MRECTCGVVAICKLCLLTICLGCFQVLLGMSKVAIVLVGFLFLHGSLEIDLAERILFWLSISSLTFAFCFQIVEILAHVVTFFKPKKFEDRLIPVAEDSSFMHSVGKDHQDFSAARLDPSSVGSCSKASMLSAHRLAALNGNVLVPQTLKSYDDVRLHDDQGKARQILDKNHLVLKVTIKGATGLPSVDCRRNRCMCIVKIDPTDDIGLSSHYKHFGKKPIAYSDGECIYKTLAEGKTSKAHSAQWNETFSVQIDDHGSLTFILWESVDASYNCLGTAFVPLEGLLSDLNIQPQVGTSRILEQAYKIFLPREKPLKTQLGKPHGPSLNLKFGKFDLLP